MKPLVLLGWLSTAWATAPSDTLKKNKVDPRGQPTVTVAGSDHYFAKFGGTVVGLTDAINDDTHL